MVKKLTFSEDSLQTLQTDNIPAKDENPEAEAEEEDAPNANTSESEAAESAPRRRVLLVQRQRFRAVR